MTDPIDVTTHGPDGHWDYVDIVRLCAYRDQLRQDMARAYMRLQCADVPRDPWHWEVCRMLGPAHETAVAPAARFMPLNFIWSNR